MGVADCFDIAVGLDNSDFRTSHSTILTQCFMYVMIPAQKNSSCELLSRGVEGSAL
jgi:hypothetical protein